MLEDVKKRLESFGYELTEEDGWAVAYLIRKVEKHILANINQPTMPEGLQEVAVDMVVGEFLMDKKNSGQEVGIDLEAAVSQIREGDTAVQFAIGSGSKTPEQRYDALVQYLMFGNQAQFAFYRGLRW